MGVLKQEMQAALDSMVAGQFVKAGEILLAALAQPERQPLTDDQIAEICMDCALVTPSDIYFARAIERAHGIGGEA